MRKLLVARISTLLAGFLFCLGSSVLAQAGDFQIILDNAHPTVKVNVLSGAGHWNFVVTVAPKARVNSLGLQIKDDGIGSADICWLTSFRKPAGMFSFATGVRVEEEIPAATLDACGPDFPDQNGAPLTLVAGYQTGDRAAVVTIDVFYPDPLVALNHSASSRATRGIVPIAFQEAWAFRRRSLRL